MVSCEEGRLTEDEKVMDYFDECICHFKYIRME